MCKLNGLGGGPGESRTPDQRFRKPLLYPSELQARRGVSILSRVARIRRVFAVPEQESPGTLSGHGAPSMAHQVYEDILEFCDINAYLDARRMQLLGRP